ncbi:MAG TPA: hypothetical protein PJ991_02440, partial [Kiritimatiellia bacterium]|nr:hypothetical protein [Kiritimatiellia bacterium]
DDNTPGRVPKGRWFTSDRGYQEALELQKSTGADIIIYFFRYDLKDEKGLCTWWERHGLQHGRVSKLLQDYIKVKVQMPFKPREREMFAEKFKFNKTPAVYIVRADGGFPTRIQVFDWPNNKPQLKDHQTLISEIQKASSQRSTSP